MTSAARSGWRTGWLVGLALGAPGGFLLLELPFVGLLIVAAAAVLLAVAGRMLAGIGGLLVGVGAVWGALFGNVKLTCHPDSCAAPNIDTYLALSFAILALGVGASVIAALRARAG